MGKTLCGTRLFEQYFKLSEKIFSPNNIMCPPFLLILGTGYVQVYVYFSLGVLRWGDSRTDGRVVVDEARAQEAENACVCT